VTINEYFLADNIPPAVMDRVWAEGWRHFGVYFFRYSVAPHDGVPCDVLPLRVELSNFVLSKSQRRVLKNNMDLRVEIRDTFIDPAKEDLFDRHRRRFKDNVPDSLENFLSEEPAEVPCRNREICAYSGDRLLAMSFLDIGETATSAVYAAFEPEEHKRSLGIFTMLRAIEHTRASGCRYYYSGYAYREPSMYDYKKKFSGLQFLDWGAGWKEFRP